MEKRYFCKKASELSLAELRLPNDLEEIIVRYHVNLEELVMFCRLDVAQNKHVDMLDFLERYHYVDASTISLDNNLSEYPISIISDELGEKGYIRSELKSPLLVEDYLLKAYVNGEMLVPLLLNYKNISGFKSGNEQYETYEIMTKEKLNQILDSLKDHISRLQLDVMRIDLEYRGLYKLSSLEMELLSFARRNCSKFLAYHIIDSIITS